MWKVQYYYVTASVWYHDVFAHSVDATSAV